MKFEDIEFKKVLIGLGVLGAVALVGLGAAITCGGVAKPGKRSRRLA